MEATSTGIEAVEFLTKLFDTGVKQVVIRFELDNRTLPTEDDILVRRDVLSVRYPWRFSKMSWGPNEEITWYVEEYTLQVVKVSMFYRHMKPEVVIHVT